MSEVKVVEPKTNKNIMPAPRVCVVTGKEYDKYSDMVWLPVFDKQSKTWRDAPTHLSKEGAWQLSKQSPTHPNNKANNESEALTISSAVKTAVAQQGVEIDTLEGILPQE